MSIWYDDDNLCLSMCVCDLNLFFCFSFYYYLAWYSGMLFVHEITTWWWKQAFPKNRNKINREKKYEMMNDMNEIEKQGFFFILNRPFDVVDMSENVMSCLVGYHHHFFCSKLIKYSFSFHRRWKNWWWWW